MMATKDWDEEREPEEIPDWMTNIFALHSFRIERFRREYLVHCEICGICLHDVSPPSFHFVEMWMEIARRKRNKHTNTCYVPDSE